MSIRNDPVVWKSIRPMAPWYHISAKVQLESLCSYARIEVERRAAHRFLSILDEGHAYQNLVQDLHNARVLVPSIQAVLDPNTGQEDIYYNDAKEHWAKDLLGRAVIMIDGIISTAGSSGSIEIFQALKTKVQALRDAAYLGKADYDYIYALPTTLFDVLEQSDLTAGVKAEQIKKLNTVYTVSDGLSKGDLPKIRVEGLHDVLTFVKGKLSTEDFAPFLTLETELETLGVKTTFTDEEITSIKRAGENLVDLIAASRLPQDLKGKVDEQVSLLYKEQVRILSSYEKAYDAIVYANEHESVIFSQMNDLISTLMSIFSSIDLSSVNIDVTSAELAGALQLTRAINTRFSDLTPDLQTAVNTVLGTLQACNVHNYLGAIWAYFEASMLLSSLPGASLAQVSEQVKEAAKEFDNTNFVLAAPTKKAMESVTSSSPVEEGRIQFDSKVNGGKPEVYTIYRHDQGTTSINTILLNYINVDQIPSGTPGMLYLVTQACRQEKASTAAAYVTFKTKASIFTNSLKTAAEVASGEKAKISSWKEELFESQLEIQSKQLEVLPLPAAVAQVLINHFMPREVDYLEKMYEDLYYSNLGSRVGNSMIQAIASYINAATYFNFASYIGQQPSAGATATDEFNGTKEQAQARLELEIKQAALYLHATEEAKNVVLAQKALVNGDTKITSEQRDAIIDALNLYNDNLNSIIGSLVLLQNYLAPLKVVEGSTSGSFKITGGSDQWQSRLEVLEDTIVSGLAGDRVSLGMFALQSTVQADQQIYADMGQNYQLEMQLHLTAMQQEWTVVATSLQILNQIYLSLARSLTS